MNPTVTSAPIGVFDSGLGGLTAVKELCRILPNEDIVYFADTARVPYGNRSVPTLTKFARQDVAFLQSKKVKSILAACGTISSALPQHVASSFGLPFSGIIPPAASAAALATKNGRIGVIATESAIATGCYQTALANINGNIAVFANACPLFVPLVEYGHFEENDPLAALVIEEYLAPLRAAKVDTLILGCTHYPLLIKAIAKYMGKDVALIDPGRQSALALANMLTKQNLLCKSGKKGSVVYYVSAGGARFKKLASLFLGQDVSAAPQEIDIEDY